MAKQECKICGWKGKRLSMHMAVKHPEPEVTADNYHPDPSPEEPDAPEAFHIHAGDVFNTHNDAAIVFLNEGGELQYVRNQNLSLLVDQHYDDLRRQAKTISNALAVHNIQQGYYEYAGNIADRWK